MRSVAHIVIFALVANSAGAGTVPAAPQAAASTGLSNAVQQGYYEGFHDCAKAMDTWVRFVHSNDDAYAMFGRWAKDHPNDSMFTTMTSEGDGGINTISAAKNASGTCDIVVTQVVPSQDPCSKLKDTLFKEWKYYGDLHTSSIYQDPTSANDSVVLVNIAGNGCLLTKQIVVFAAPK